MKRYCELIFTEDESEPQVAIALLLYASKSRKKLTGEIDLKTISRVIPSVVIDSPPFALDLVNEIKGMHYTLAFSNKREQILWYIAFSRAIEAIRLRNIDKGAAQPSADDRI